MDEKNIKFLVQYYFAAGTSSGLMMNELEKSLIWYLEFSLNFQNW